MRKVMMNQMIVIVQEQQPPEPPRLVDDGAMLVSMCHAMFLKRADRTQRQRPITRADDKGPGGDSANTLKPHRQRDQCGQMRKPHRHMPPIAAFDTAEFIDTRCRYG